MSKLTLNDLSNLENQPSAVALINANNALIEDALEKTLSRDGTTPNTMVADLDMNSNRIINLLEPVSDSEPIRKGDVSGATLTTLAGYVTAAQLAETNAETAQGLSEDAQAAAETAQTASETAKGLSETAKTASETAQGLAEDAQTAAETAQGLAETAKTAAETSETNAASSASAASTSASSASTSASTATTQAGNAATSASAASTSATNAATSEANALAYSARYKGTSTTSVTIGTGSKGPFTTQASKNFDVGVSVLITSNADTTNYMHGQVTAYSGTSLTVNVTDIGGSGTHTDWTITVSGTRGATGAAGTLDFTLLTTDTVVSTDYLAFGDVSDSQNPNKVTVADAVIAGAGGTPVITTAIGSTVQAYDVDTAKLDVAQTWAA